jgi:nicotinamide-nucleotide amidase
VGAESPDDAALQALAERLGALLNERGLRVATAESCTGGWIAKLITDIAGSSAWFEQGLVTYGNAAKQQWLGVPEPLLIEHGAVSEPVVQAMAEGVLTRSGADLAVAVSGIAGPGGGTQAKPVGTVWLGWTGCGPPRTRLARYPGDREAVRRAAAATALQGLIDRVTSP